MEVGRDVHDKAFVHDDAIGVATISDASEVLVREVISERHVAAELLRPAWHSAQVLSESTMQPTAATSPGLNFVTAEPTLVTRPTISWPGTQAFGYMRNGDFLKEGPVNSPSFWRAGRRIKYAGFL